MFSPKKITEKIDEFTSWWATLSIKHYWLITIVTATILLVALYQASKLKLESDFQAMLPRNYRSVVELHRYQREVGSTTSLSIALMTENIEAAKRFADELAPILEEQLGDRIAYVEYKITDVRKFFKKHAFLYLSTDEVKSNYQKLKHYIGKLKLKSTGLLFEVDEEKEEQQPPVDLDEIFSHYNKKAAKEYGTRQDGYYINDSENLLAMRVVPRPGFSGVGEARKLIAQIEEKIKQLSPKKYSPELTYGFAGPVKVSVEEYEAIKKDILNTISICVSLIIVVLFIYFLKIRHIILIAITLGVGITVDMAITSIVIGYLNAQTAFLGSIIVGTGINYSIILLARYTEERRGGGELNEALPSAMRSTWKATASAAVTTAAAFGTLGLSKNLSFKQFGFIASTGIMLIWITTIISLPALVVLSEKIKPLTKGGRNYREIPFMPASVAKVVISKPLHVTVLGLILTALCAFVIIRWLPNSLEYDFSKLRNKMTFKSGTEALDKRIVHECIHRSTTPVVAIVDKPADALNYCRVLERKKKKNPKKYLSGECVNIYTFIPNDQEEKIKYLRKTEELLSENEALIPENFAKQHRKYRDMLKANTIGIKDLPQLIRMKFRNKSGKDGIVVLIKPGANLWKYENLHRFVNTVRTITLDNGKKIYAVGTPIIFYDLVQTVAHDAPRDTIYAIIAVFIIILLIVGRQRAAFAITTTLIVAVTTMVGLVAVTGTKINFFNFVAIPTAFGTGADYGINILTRYMLEKKSVMDKDTLLRSMIKTGGAVFLCSSTTIIGYFSLMTSNNQALVSYGKLAIAGEIGCLLAAVLLLPALILKLKV